MIKTIPEKRLVEQHFQRSVGSYNGSAKAQEHICRVLAQQIARCTLNPARILEIGCGTGLLTQKLMPLFPKAEWWINDLCPQSVNHTLNRAIPALKKANPLEGDAEAIPFPSNIDLCVSASTLQWFENLPAFMQKVAQHLNPGGYFIFSTFGKANLSEIKAITGNGLAYPAQKEIEQWLQESGFAVVSSFEEEIRLQFSSPREILRHLKATGVNGGFSQPWSKGSLTRFEERYAELFANNGGFPLTYTPIYFIAQRKG